MEFPPLTPEQAIREANTLRRIAVLLGSASFWDNPDGYLETLAERVEALGYPHPGDTINTQFYRGYETAELPEPVDAEPEYEYGIRAHGISGQVVGRPNKEAAEDIYDFYSKAPNLYGKVELCRRARPHTWQTVKASQ